MFDLIKGGKIMEFVMIVFFNAANPNLNWKYFHFLKILAPTN